MAEEVIVPDFEKPLLKLENEIKELKKLGEEENIDFSKEIKKLEKKYDRLRKEIFSKLTPWQRVQLARHPKRPHSIDYIKMIFHDFIELHGDRRFSDDPSIIAGICKFSKKSVCVIGQEKGRDINEKTKRNFGMPHPEGYRKALRIMKLAERFSLPIITFIDTPGAFPGIGAEERGQAEAIARNLYEMSGLKTPIISIIIGEGGSGGALALSVSDVILMLENAIYSVISPEGCASILFRDSSLAEKAAEALKLTSFDLKKLGVIDEIVEEPIGGAHKNPEETAERIKGRIDFYLKELEKYSISELLKKRYKKFRIMGKFKTKK